MFTLIPTRVEEGQEMSGAATAEGYEEEEEDTENFTFCDLLFCFFEELKDYKKSFNLNDCAEGILLKVFLPTNDIISDFLVADKLFQSENVSVKQWFTFFSYYFIAWPGIMFLLSNIRIFRDRCCFTFCQGSFLPFIFMVCFFSLEAVLILYAHPKILLPAAAFVAGVTLIVGIMDIFFHGPYMKKLSSLITCYEGRFESAPQLVMQLVLLISGQGFFQGSGLDFYGLCTSLVMLAKDLSENILTNGKNDSLLLSMSFPQKIAEMWKIFPVIMLTALFRLGTMALLIHHVFVLDSGLLLVPLKLIFMVPPVVTILSVQRFYPEVLELSVTECFVGILGEMSAFTNWGKLNPECSRWFQFGLNLYFCILYGVYCVWTVFNPPSENADLFAICFLCCGWVSFPLYISQIFFINTTQRVFPDSREIGREHGNECQHVKIKLFLI